MTKKSLLTKFSALILVLCTLFTAVSVNASAATCSSGTSTRTITVETKANWWIPGSESITLSQTKGIRTGTSGGFLGLGYLTGKTKTKTTSCYGTWTVSYRSSDNSDKGSKKLSGSSLKIKLKPNKTYTITVSWDGYADTVDSIAYGNFTTLPTWKVKSTYKVSNYY